MSRGSVSPPRSFDEKSRAAAKQTYDFATYAQKPEASPVQPSKVVPFDLTRYAPKPHSKASEKPVKETSGSSAYDPTKYAPPQAKNTPPKPQEKPAVETGGSSAYDPTRYAPPWAKNTPPKPPEKPDGGG